MNEENERKLIEKYQAGESTLNEEQTLFDNTKDSENPMSPWFKFVSHNKRKPPKNLNTSIWEAIETGNKQKNRFYKTLLTSAAAILLLVAVPVVLQNKKKEFLYKEAMLIEALSLFDKNEQLENNRQVLYEDEIVIIYAVE